ncbi:MAG TPA: MFS transporter [Frankiaceae bacterium]|nr:MFS transporter [Frankiaceae bacterium]
MALVEDREGGVADPLVEVAGTDRARARLTLIVVSLGVMMVGIDGSVVSIANPFIARSLHASLADLQWVTNAYLLSLAVLLIVGGKLGDRYGRKKLFLIGVIGFALASVAIGLVGSISGVIAFRVLQGAFGAILMPNTLALLRSAYSEDELTRAVGTWSSAAGAATAAGPILGGLLVDNVSWESVFYLNVPVAIATLALGIPYLLESRESHRDPIDWPGVLTLAGGLSALIYGLVKGQEWGWVTGRTLGTLGLAVVLMASFIFVESRATSPLLPLWLFKDRSVSMGSLIVLLNFFALFGVLFFVSLYLQSVSGYSALSAGLRTLPLTAVFSLSSPLGARITTRYGPRIPIGFGLLSVAIALLLLTSLEPNSAYWHLWPEFILLGLGIGMVISASTEAIVGNVDIDHAGVAGGLQATSIQLGGVLGTAVLGSVLAGRVGSVLFDKLTGAGVEPALAQQLQLQKEVVGQGVAPVPPGSSDHVAAAITHGSHAAFMSGLHVSMLVAAVITLIGAALTPLIRRGDPMPEGAVVPH